MLGCYNCITEYTRKTAPNGYCSNCQTYSVIQLPTRIIKEKDETRKRFKSAKDISKQKFSGKKIKNFEFLGYVPKKFTIMVFGGEGSGKTIFSLKLGNQISIKEPVVYCSIEEGDNSDTIRKKIEENGTDSENLIFVPELLTDVTDYMKEVKAKHLFIDSISEGTVKIERLKELKKEVPGVLLYIMHGTKDDMYKGNTDYGHLCDIVCRVRDLKVTFEKNRLGPKTGEYEIVWGLESGNNLLEDSDFKDVEEAGNPFLEKVKA